MNKTPPSTLTLNRQKQALDFRAINTFDALIVHHNQKQLINTIKEEYPKAVFRLDQDLLRYHMIDSPVMIAIEDNSDISLIIEAHINNCELLDTDNGLLALLDYTPAQRRINKTRISAYEFLPDSYLAQHTQSSDLEADLDQNRIDTWMLDMGSIAGKLSRNQIIQLGGQKKHLRYLDPQVLIHFLSLGYHAYIANRFVYPTRLWLPIDKDLQRVDGIDKYPATEARHMNSHPSYCPITPEQLDNISIINRFLTQNGINKKPLIIDDYPLIQQWVDDSKKRLAKAVHLTNRVDRQTMMNRWLLEYYVQYSASEQSTH